MTFFVAAFFIVALIGFAAARPGLALAVLAAFFPIAPAAFTALFGWPVRAAELFPLAIACGVLAARIWRDRPAPGPRAFIFATAAMAVVILTSVAVHALLTRVVLSPDGFSAALLEYARTYFDGSRTFNYAAAAMTVLTGLALSVAVACYAREAAVSERMLRLLLTGAAAVGCLNIARMAGVVLRSATPLSALPLALTHVRIAAPYGDPNATGSFFALLFPIAVALAISAQGRMRGYYATLAVIHASALWMSGSRAALVAMATVGSVVGVRHLRRGARTDRPRRAAAVLALLALFVVALWLFPNSIVDRGSTTGALGIRAEMARVAVRLWKTDPLLGVGLGQFLDRSADHIVDPYVRTLYGRENAHNNFLQILAELGVIGLVAFLLILVAALRGAAPFALRAGVAAFLVTCLGGHPLLVPDVAFAFWMVLGAAAAWQTDLGLLRRVPIMAVVIGSAALISAPISYRIERAALSLDHIGFGLTAWIASPEGGYRRAEGDATVFVPLAARQIVIHIKPVSPASQPVRVRLWLNGRPADEFALPTEAWQTYRLPMPSTRETRYAPLRIAAVDSQGVAVPFLLQKVESLPR